MPSAHATGPVGGIGVTAPDLATPATGPDNRFDAFEGDEPGGDAPDVGFFEDDEPGGDAPDVGFFEGDEPGGDAPDVGFFDGDEPGGDAPDVGFFEGDEPGGDAPDVGYPAAEETDPAASRDPAGPGRHDADVPARDDTGRDDESDEHVRRAERPLGSAPLLDSKPLPATMPGMLRPRGVDAFTLPAQRPAFDIGPGEPADIT
jgi:hypothetical protein